jgi:hypothetical protein
MRGQKHRKVSGWVVTWHRISDASTLPKRDNEVAAIFSSRLGGGRVREFVELIYVTSGSFTLNEQISMMWPRHGKTPYAARFGQTTDGQPWAGEILCGDDPLLKARLVDDLTVKLNDKGIEEAAWKERSRPTSYLALL